VELVRILRLRITVGLSQLSQSKEADNAKHAYNAKATSVFSVSLWFVLQEHHHGGTENTEVAQRSNSNQTPTALNRQDSRVIMAILQSCQRFTTT